MKKLPFALIFFFAIFYGCSTDFDVVGPYKEILVIDGFLDYTDSVQIIRIKKAYLGEGDVVVMAKQKDSTQLQSVLDVKLEKLLGSQVTAQFSLVPFADSTKEAGTFYAPDQILYKCTNRLVYDGSKYRLVVRNTSTGVVATSTVTLIKDLTISPRIPEPYDFTSASVPAFPSLFTFTPGENAYICDMLVRFNYTEYDSSTGVTSFKTVELNREDRLAQSEITYKILKPEFWEFLGRTIPVKQGVLRRVDNLPSGYKPLEFVFLQGSEDMNTYIQLQSSSGLSIDVPSFTTVQNGLGLVTSRVVNKSSARSLHPNTIAAFDTSVYTRNLNFRF